MKVGDLVKFTGSWGPTVSPGDQRVGIVMKIWTNGRTQKKQSADVLWDNGHFLQSSIHMMEVISESR